MNRQKIAWLGAGVTAVTGLGLYLALRPPAPPTAAELTAENAAKTLATADLSKLSPAEKARYAARLRELRIHPRGQDASLNDAERQKLRENSRELFEEAMRQRVAAYFKLPPEQRAAYLDRQIAELPAGWGRGGPGGNAPGGGTRPPGAQPNPAGGDRRAQHLARMKERIETGTPVERAQFTQYMRDLRARRQATPGR